MYKLILTCTYFYKQAINTNKYVLLRSRNMQVKRARGFGLAWAVGGPVSAAPSGSARSSSPSPPGPSGSLAFSRRGKVPARVGSFFPAPMGKNAYMRRAPASPIFPAPHGSRFPGASPVAVRFVVGARFVWWSLWGVFCCAWLGSADGVSAPGPWSRIRSRRKNGEITAQ